MNEIAGVFKVLSANDIGTTGGHQAGILIPKRKELLSFFPPVDPATKNPRHTLSFLDEDGLTTWDFSFIYYNNKNFGGTRDEYRLTRMTKYLRAHGLEVGDEVRLSKDKFGGLHIQCRRSVAEVESDDAIVLTGGWKVISMRKR